MITPLILRKSAGGIHMKGNQYTPPPPFHRGGIHGQIWGGNPIHPIQEGRTPVKNFSPAHQDTTFHQLDASAQGVSNQPWGVGEMGY